MTNPMHPDERAIQVSPNGGNYPAYPPRSGGQLILTGQVPYTQEGEEATIGACLINPKSFLACWKLVKPEDFYILRHSYIWEAMKRIVDAGLKRREDRRQQGKEEDDSQSLGLDYLTLQEELKAQGRLAEIGGSAYLTQLINATPTSVHALIYANLVKRAAVRRRLLLYADEIKSLAMDEELALEVVLQDVEARKQQAVGKAIHQEKWRPLIDVISDYMDVKEQQMISGKKPHGQLVGLRDIDDGGGVEGGELVIFAGRPAMGKSAALGTVAVNMMSPIEDQPPQRGISLSMEMLNDRNVERYLARKSNIPGNVLRSSILDQTQWKKFVSAAGELSKGELLMSDDDSMTVEELYTSALYIMEVWPFDYVLVDYLQLMEVEIARHGWNNKRHEDVGKISRTLKKMAQALGVPVYSAAQIGRQVEQREDKRPMPSDLRESGNLEQDADRIYMLYRPNVYESKYPAWMTEVIAPKVRNQASGLSVFYNWFYDGAHTFFRDLEFAEEQELKRISKAAAEKKSRKLKRVKDDYADDHDE